ncbi:MAG: DUF563 domain-containing protein [Pseudodesulfovibrio sp.]|nr:glycosyltransferase 61 family protein [Pseudodesulfovibrio indicus]
MTTPPTLLGIEDAIVTGRSAILTAQGRAVVGTSLIHDVNNENKLLAGAAEVIPHKQDFRRLPKAFMLAQAGDSIYGHWLLDLLPQAVVGRDNLPPDVPFLVRRNIPEYAVRLLERIGIPEKRLLREMPPMGPRHELEDCLRVGTLYAATCARNNTYLDRSRGEVYDQLLSMATKTPAVRADRVFISRTAFHQAEPNKAKRRMINAAQVEGIFSQLGFACVQPEKLPFPDQVALFYHAGIIAGEDGSALHNAIWSKPGSTLICLMSPLRENEIHHAVAETKALHFRLLKGRLNDDVAKGLKLGSVTPAEAHVAPWTIDPRALKEALTCRDFA